MAEISSKRNHLDLCQVQECPDKSVTLSLKSVNSSYFTSIIFNIFGRQTDRHNGIASPCWACMHRMKPSLHMQFTDHYLAMYKFHCQHECKNYLLFTCLSLHMHFHSSSFSHLCPSFVCYCQASVKRLPWGFGEAHLVCFAFLLLHVFEWHFIVGVQILLCK